MIDATKTHRNQTVWLLAALVVLAAALLRLWNLPNVPFGWHPDEATKALLARDVLAGKYFPAFFSAFTGREALYVYLEAGSFLLLGERIFAAKLLSAFIGVLTVALTYTTGRMLFNRRIGLFAAVLIATSLWHLIASRNGYRAVIQPLIQLPVILLAFKGWRSEGRTALASFAAAGFWLGLTQYTYTAARFFPLFLVALVLAAALFLRGDVGIDGRGILLMFLIALIVVVPLAVHFIRNPVDFYGRAAQISVFSAQWSNGEPLARLWQSVKETARMFTVWGDINYRFNIAGQPVFDPVIGGLFYVGLLLSLWRAWFKRGLRRLAYIAVILWTGIMLLPMTLSAESLPYYQRAIGSLPAIFFFPALALDGALAGLARVNARFESAPSTAAPAVAVVLLALLGGRVSVAYFENWHLAHRNDDDRRVAMVYVADYLRRSHLPQPLYLSTQYVQHPTLALLAPLQYEQVQWFDASQSLPLPPAGSPATYVMLLENAPQTLLLDEVPALEETHMGYDRFGRPVFKVYRWGGAAWPVAAHTEPASWSWQVDFGTGADPRARHEIELPVNFGDVVAFRGYDRQPVQVTAGDKLALVLFWELLQRPPRQYTFFAHLLDAGSKVVAGYDANTYPSTFWNEGGGELLLSYFPLSLPRGLAAGEYQLEIGVYNQPSGERLPILQNGASVADRLLLQPLVIQ